LQDELSALRSSLASLQADNQELALQLRMIKCDKTTSNQLMVTFPLELAEKSALVGPETDWCGASACRPAGVKRRLALMDDDFLSTNDNNSNHQFISAFNNQQNGGKGGVRPANDQNQGLRSLSHMAATSNADEVERLQEENRKVRACHINVNVDISLVFHLHFPFVFRSAAA